MAIKDIKELPTQYDEEIEALATELEDLRAEVKAKQHKLMDLRGKAGDEQLLQDLGWKHGDVIRHPNHSWGWGKARECFALVVGAYRYKSSEYTITVKILKTNLKRDKRYQRTTLGHWARDLSDWEVIGAWDENLEEGRRSA